MDPNRLRDSQGTVAIFTQSDTKSWYISEQHVSTVAVEQYFNISIEMESAGDTDEIRQAPDTYYSSSRWDTRPPSGIATQHPRGNYIHPELETCPLSASTATPHVQWSNTHYHQHLIQDFQHLQQQQQQQQLPIPESTASLQVMKPIELDGRTGEGGGQLVRVAVGLAALTSQPIKITDVRGNRPGSRGGGLKNQHFAAIKWLAEATEADVGGLHVGSKTLTFIPRRSPTELLQRNSSIRAESGAASILLIVQAMLPYILFAGNDSGEPVVVELSGGTNVGFSLSYEYFDQVLMPTLEERFGIQVERKLKARGWSLGPLSRGTVWLKVHPVPKGKKLQYKPPPQYKYPESYDVESIDVSIVIPMHSHAKAQETLVKDLGDLWPGVDVTFKVVEDSGHDGRWTILLVAHSTDGIRWGRDILASAPKKLKSYDQFIAQQSRKVCKELYEEISVGGQVDEHLQDQLVCFQALCDGFSSFSRGDEPEESSSTGPLIDAMGKLEIGDGRMRKEKTHEPFGHGSTHTQTARWVVSELLPKAEFFNKGNFVNGVGFSL
ncbi:RNA 3'-terminal phosphate cyclase [Cladobotryum mycophilum]|uniref:RNA 3'-terminal phosphate cyclase n=1 Tax=Cladobotryum mycophilum TaxID=491253 RepID=A0ABR0SG46_9HYPO